MTTQEKLQPPSCPTAVRCQGAVHQPLAVQEPHTRRHLQRQVQQRLNGHRLRLIGRGTARPQVVPKIAQLGWLEQHDVGLACTTVP